MPAVTSNPFLATKARPLIVGHRGVPLVHQENTLAGFRRAVAMGLDAIELDVRLTADHRAIVLHDHNLRRLTGSSFDVDHLAWDQISKLRIRRSLPMGVDAHGAAVTMTYEREEPIPLLAEVLAEIAGKVAINIELKVDIPRWWGTRIARVVADLAVAADVTDRVIVTSFDPRKLLAVARARRSLAVGFCFDDTMLSFATPILDRLPRPQSTLSAHGNHGVDVTSHRWLNRLLETNLVGQLLKTQLVGAEHTLIGLDTVRRLHARGMAVGTHTLFPLGSTTGKRIAPTAHSVAELERLVDLGLDWIETDDPERVQALLG